MYRFFTVILMSIFIISLSGCGGILGKIFAKQELSENYAQLEGTTATAPEMIDGDLKTSAQSVFSEGSEHYYGGTAPSEAIVTLPEKKLIRKVIIHSDNMKTLDILADKGDGDWEILKEVKSVNTSPIEAKVGALFKTDRIMIRVHSTTDDASRRRREGVRWGGGRRSARGAPANIQEIELYGYATKEEIEARKEEEEKQAEDSELDILLK